MEFNMIAYMQLLEKDVLRYEEFLRHMDQLSEEDQLMGNFVHIADVVKQVVESVN